MESLLGRPLPSAMKDVISNESLRMIGLPKEIERDLDPSGERATNVNKRWLADWNRKEKGS